MKPSDQTYAALIAAASASFSEHRIETAGLDARLLMEGASGFSHAQLISKAGDNVPADVAQKYKAWTERRISGKPVHRILGYREFFGRKFKLSPETLVPRDETELLVETVLETCGGLGKDQHFLEIGTGSGIIAVTLACEMEAVQITATDISLDALKTATENARMNRVEKQIEFERQNIFDCLKGRYHAIISNPPYIATSEIDGLSREVKNHDPIAALDGGVDGLSFYREILGQASAHLFPGGHVFLEIGFGQAEAVQKIAEANGFEAITIREDYSGIPRVVSMCH